MNDCKGNRVPPSSTLEQSTLLISTPEFHYNLPDDNADFSHFQMVTIDPEFVSEIKGPIRHGFNLFPAVSYRNVEKTVKCHLCRLLGVGNGSKVVVDR